MESEIYSEKQAMKFRWPLAVLGAAIMIVGAAGTWEKEPYGAATMIFFALVFALVIWGFTVFSIVVTPTELRFGFPLFRKRFALSELEIGDVEKIGLLAGIGIHFWNRKWVYNARLGRGVNLTHGRYHYLVGSEQPEQLQSALMQLIPRRMGNR